MQSILCNYDMTGGMFSLFLSFISEPTHIIPMVFQCYSVIVCVYHNITNIFMISIINVFCIFTQYGIL